MEQIIVAILALSAKYGIDPNLVQAIVQVESSYRLTATGPAGEIGLMQLKPSSFPNASRSVYSNIEAGVRYLASFKAKCTNFYGAEAWFICYNIGPGKDRGFKDPKANPYFRKVISAKKEIIAKDKRSVSRNRGALASFKNKACLTQMVTEVLGDREGRGRLGWLCFRREHDLLVQSTKRRDYAAYSPSRIHACTSLPYTRPRRGGDVRRNSGLDHQAT